MLRYQAIVKQPRKFLAMTGYTEMEFEALLPYFVAEFEAYVAVYRLDGQKRQKRRYSEYRNSPLPTGADKLLFILIYLKQGSLQEAHATLFGMHQPDANHWIHLLHPLLKQALGNAGELPARTVEEIAISPFEAGLYFHDGTERPIVRPIDPRQQRLCYSGKQKMHTLKNLILINALCKILFLSRTAEGKKHDKKLADEEADYRLAQHSVLYQDTGFQAFDLDGITMMQPKKKVRNRPLTDQEKASNRAISSIRIRVEHAINGVKRFRIVKDKIRNWKADFRDQVMETCCGLHNFRLNFRPWHYQIKLLPA